jgi:pyruvate dehydrogenase E2 component (dihydrolipoamide acetyltransferase)
MALKGEATVRELSARQRQISRRVAEARATVPDFELTADVDMEACVGLDAPTPSLLIRACALALRETPEANAAYRDGRVELYSRINVAFAVATGDAYLTPTVFDADRKSLSYIAADSEELARRARSGELSPPELSGATFTLSAVGERGIRSATPILIPPQAAGLAAGSIREVPVVRDGAVVPGHVLTLTLVCDHRILYGAPAAALLQRIKDRLEQGALT